jgi:hypothetical protein
MGWSDRQTSIAPVLSDHSRERHRAMFSLRKPSIVVSAVLFAFAATPASATSSPSTRLVRCGTETCVLVSGHRDNIGSEVRINGRVVTVEGKRHWHARLPVATVRSWSSAFQRTLEITLHDTATQAISSARADLPIGLMGHTDLAMLVVGVH